MNVVLITYISSMFPKDKYADKGNIPMHHHKKNVDILILEIFSSR